MELLDERATIRWIEALGYRIRYDHRYVAVYKMHDAAFIDYYVGGIGRRWWRWPARRHLTESESRLKRLFLKEGIRIAMEHYQMRGLAI